MSSIHAVIRHLVAALLVVATSLCQVSVGGVGLTTAGGQPVNPAPNVDVNAGGVVNVRNDGPAAVVLSVHASDGSVVAEMGLLNPHNQNVALPASLTVGDYTIKLRQSGQDIKDATKVGTLHVHPTE